MFSKIILASQSPRRKQLLEWAEVPFEVIVKTTDETFPEGMPAEEVAIHIARNKAEAVKRSLSENKKLPILAADTIVVLKNKIIGKPNDRNDAISILTSLSGNKHKVITGVVILNAHKTISFADTTEVKFHSLTNKEIEFYVDKYKPYDKAGAYGAQDWIGMVAIEKIVGSYFNVMGLPIHKVHHHLVSW